jgi:hypothetical protein
MSLCARAHAAAQSLQKSIIIKRPFGTSLGGCAARRAAQLQKKGVHIHAEQCADVGFAILTCMTSNIALLLNDATLNLYIEREQREKQTNLFFIFSLLRLFLFLQPLTDPKFWLHSISLSKKL